VPLEFGAAAYVPKSLDVDSMRAAIRAVLDGGRCIGVETDDGEQYLASTAVLSTIHVTHLRDMAPADAWPEEFHYGIDTYDLGVPGFGVYLATSAPPEFETPDGPVTAVSAGTVGWPEDVVQLGQDLRAGRFVSNVPWLLVATPTLVDPGRAPAGKHTVKVLSHQVYELPAGMPDWEQVKAEHAARQLAYLRTFTPGFTDDVVIRVAWHGGGSRIDVRSLSRQGQGDFGVNAARVRTYLAALKPRLAAPAG